jgi:hypothetical protein
LSWKSATEFGGGLRGAVEDDVEMTRLLQANVRDVEIAMIGDSSF